MSKARPLKAASQLSRYPQNGPRRAELASAIPAEGGFCIWVRRALGPFWDIGRAGFRFQPASSTWPSIRQFCSRPGTIQRRADDRLVRLCLVAGGCGRVLFVESAGAPAVGEGAIGLFILTLSPFAVFLVLELWRGLARHPAVQWTHPVSGAALSTAVLVGMWNYMGWDNASTVAQEVDHPQRNYPRAMVAAATLTAITYIFPVLALALAGLSVQNFSTGDWMTAGSTLGGQWPGLLVLGGGVICGVGMFNALMMSYTRLPMAVAEDGMLPRFIAQRNRRGVPWVSVLLCGLAWALALRLPFERLISVDLILYGSSLLLVFVALIVLRIREPKLERPFKAGNLAFACVLTAGPTALIAYALYASRGEKLMGYISAPAFAVGVALLGPIISWLTIASLARVAAAPDAE